jgi:hypothetical protein
MESGSGKITLFAQHRDVVANLADVFGRPLGNPNGRSLLGLPKRSKDKPAEFRGCPRNQPGCGNAVLGQPYPGLGQGRNALIQGTTGAVTKTLCPSCYGPNQTESAALTRGLHRCDSHALRKFSKSIARSASFGHPFVMMSCA